MTPIKMMLSYNNNEKVVQVPVIPNELPEIIQDIANEEIITNTNTLTLLGNGNPRNFTLELFLPTRDYEFCKGNGREVLDLVKHVTANKIPARMIITDNIEELLNIAFSVKSYTYHYDTAKNIRATIECVEYEFIDLSVENQEENTAPVFSDTTVSYGGKTTGISATNVDGYNLIRARDVLELLDMEVDWNPERKQVIADGELLDIHTEIYDGCAYCYVRDLAAATGHEVSYNAEDKSVTII